MAEENNEDLFATFDIADALDDPFSVKDGTYQGAISDVEIRTGEKKHDDGTVTKWKSMVVTFTSSDPNVNSYAHWYGIPSPDDAENVVSLKRSALKSLLSGLEIPESRMNQVKPTQLIATECVWTIRTNKKGFKNIKVSLPKGSPVATTADGDSLMAEIGASAGSNANFGL